MLATFLAGFVLLSGAAAAPQAKVFEADMVITVAPELLGPTEPPSIVSRETVTLIKGRAVKRVTRVDGNVVDVRTAGRAGESVPEPRRGARLPQGLLTVPVLVLKKAAGDEPPVSDFIRWCFAALEPDELDAAEAGLDWLEPGRATTVHTALGDVIATFVAEREAIGGHECNLIELQPTAIGDPRGKRLPDFTAKLWRFRDPDLRAAFGCSQVSVKVDMPQPRVLFTITLLNVKRMSPPPRQPAKKMTLRNKR